MATNTNKKTQNATTEAEKVREYKIMGKAVESKEKAKTELLRAKKKGFRGVTLCVNGNKFAVLYGTYLTEKAAQACMEYVKQEGFEVEVK